jgi:hypothetical protein
VFVILGSTWSSFALVVSCSNTFWRHLHRSLRTRQGDVWPLGWIRSQNRQPCPNPWFVIILVLCMSLTLGFSSWWRFWGIRGPICDGMAYHLIHLKHWLFSLVA